MCRFLTASKVFWLCFSTIEPFPPVGKWLISPFTRLELVCQQVIQKKKGNFNIFCEDFIHGPMRKVKWGESEELQTETSPGSYFQVQKIDKKCELWLVLTILSSNLGEFIHHLISTFNRVWGAGGDASLSLKTADGKQQGQCCDRSPGRTPFSWIHCSMDQAQCKTEYRKMSTSSLIFLA